MRLKIEINSREHFSVSGLKKLPFVIHNPWFSGQADITVFSFEELLATKLRALYQRNKGRDLFDLWYAYQKNKFEPALVIPVYEKYMEFATGKTPTRKQYALNLENKMNDPFFVGDLEGLLRPDISFNFQDAFKWFADKILPSMK